MPGEKYLQTILHQITLGSNGQVLTRDDTTMNGVVFKDPAVTPATTNASDLTSGTLNAARLPGVLANVSTQPQLLAAAGAAVPTKYARLSRVTSNQSSISGSWAQDYLQYNEITEDNDGIIDSISGDDITIAEPGTYLILQTLYSNNNLAGYINVSVNGVGVSTSDPIILASTTAIAYFRYMWVIRTTAANQVLKMGFFSLATSQMDYTDSNRPGNVNFLEILKLG